jgi:NAD(P)-dependent dehydrogenase (short-subunit alcohol dehydrogenase family)
MPTPEDVASCSPLVPRQCSGTAEAITLNVAATASRPLRVVITGGSKGIGQAIVKDFAAAGHRVLFTYLHSVESAEELTAKYPNVTMVLLDQGDVRSVTRFAKVAKAWAGEDGVDVLVNNAALGSATVKGYVSRRSSLRKSASMCSDSDDLVENNNGEHGTGMPSVDKALDAVLQEAAEDEALMCVNALGPLWVTNAIMPLLRAATSSATARRRHATVIFIGSVGGGSSAVFPEYRPSDLMGKAAMTYLSKHLAAEHVRDEIDVMTVSPGATETDMFQKSTLSKLEDVGRFIDAMPKRRLIQPSDVAETVRWLATSPAARILHGSVLDASMGLAVRPGLQTESQR